MPNMIIVKANAKNILGNQFAFPLQKRKRNNISRFSFVIVFCVDGAYPLLAHPRVPFSVRLIWLRFGPGTVRAVPAFGFGRFLWQNGSCVL